MTRSPKSDWTAVNEIFRAAQSVHRLRSRVVPGHIPLAQYLNSLERDLLGMAHDLHKRLIKESGDEQGRPAHGN